MAAGFDVAESNAFDVQAEKLYPMRIDASQVSGDECIGDQFGVHPRGPGGFEQLSGEAAEAIGGNQDLGG